MKVKDMHRLLALSVAAINLNDCECVVHDATPPSSMTRGTTPLEDGAHRNGVASIDPRHRHAIGVGGPGGDGDGDGDGDASSLLRRRHASESASHGRNAELDPSTRNDTHADMPGGDGDHPTDTRKMENVENYETEVERSATPPSDDRDLPAADLNPAHHAGEKEEVAKQLPSTENGQQIEATSPAEGKQTAENDGSGKVDEPVSIPKAENDGALDENTKVALVRHEDPPEERAAQGDSIFPFDNDNIFGDRPGAEAARKASTPTTRIGT